MEHSSGRALTGGPRLQVLVREGWEILEKTQRMFWSIFSTSPFEEATDPAAIDRKEMSASPMGLAGANTCGIGGLPGDGEPRRMV